MRPAVTCSAIALLAVGLVALSGCGEATDVTLHKPGVYKGPKDPLVEKQRDPKQQEALVARFNQVQTDR
jgi:hypothetical protein